MERRVAEDVYMKQMIELRSQSEQQARLEASVAEDLRMKERLQEESL